MKLKILRLLFVIISSNNLIIGQTDAQKAQIRVHITNANSALQSSNWDQALSNVTKAQEALGSSAAIFESIRIKAFHGKKNYQKAKEHLLIFFQLTPSNNLIDEIAPISSDVDNKIETELAEKRKADERKRKIEEEKRRVEEEKRKRIQAEKERELAKRQKEEKEKTDFLNNLNLDFYEFEEGLTPVKYKGKYGYIDKTGKETIPFQYDGASNFRGNLAKVKLNGKFGCIDRNGKVVVPIKYDEADPGRGSVRVKLNGKVGHTDEKGNIIVPIKYNQAHFFSEGLVCVELNGKHGYVGKTGNEVIPLKYDQGFMFFIRIFRYSVINGL